MGCFDYSETRFAANGFGKTTPKLVSLPEKVPERTLSVRGKAGGHPGRPASEAAGGE